MIYVRSARRPTFGPSTTPIWTEVQAGALVHRVASQPPFVCCQCRKDEDELGEKDSGGGGDVMICIGSGASPLRGTRVVGVGRKPRGESLATLQAAKKKRDSRGKVRRNSDLGAPDLPALPDPTSAESEE